MTKPSLSVIVPVYNSGNYLLDAVQSILDQEREIELEVIVVNDHSNESETLDVLQWLENNAPQVQLLNNTGRRGPAAARNFGLKFARGEWIGFLDADDIWPTGSLKARWKVVSREPDAHWVAGELVNWMPDGSIIPRSNNIKTKYKEKAKKAKYFRVDDTLKLMCAPPYLMLGCMLIRKDIIDQVGGFDENLHCSEDWYLSISIARHTDLYFVPQVVQYLRRHSKSLTAGATTKNKTAYRAAMKAYFDRNFRKVRRIIRWTLISQLKNLSNYHYEHASKGASAKYALLAWLWGPNDAEQFKRVAHRFSEIFTKF